MPEKSSKRPMRVKKKLFVRMIIMEEIFEIKSCTEILAKR